MRLGVTINCTASTSYHRQPVVGTSTNSSLNQFNALKPSLLLSLKGSISTARAPLRAPQATRIPKRDILCQSADSSTSQASDKDPSRRTPWNKGKQMSDEHRLAISKAQKKRWQDPEVRSTVSESLKGKTAWNKGRTLSEETKEKMSLAHLNLTHSKTTRQKMRNSKLGKPRSPEICAAVSASLSGKHKSEEHKASIASTQRRRLAASRVLKAVEAVYDTESSPEEGLGPKGVSLSMKKERSAALNAFKAELREYRALQEELSPWTQAFKERHGRKPTTVDVQGTGIDWLISRYKQYIYLRERIFNESTVLRSRLDGASTGPSTAAVDGTFAIAAANSAGPTNANGPTVGAKSVIASRVAAAMQYKLKKESSSNNAAAAKPAAAAAGLPTNMYNTNAAVEEEENTAGFARVAAIQNAMQPQTPPRVRAAMQAAMDYRKRKAEATKAKAEAAAVTAKAGWNNGKLSPAASSLKNIENGGAAAAGMSAEKEEGPSCLLPADIVRAQAAAHRAMKEVRQAEAEVRRALRWQENQSDGDDGENIIGVAGASI